MKISVEELNATRKKLTVSIPKSFIKETEQSLVKEFASQAQLPGFRPGKAPDALVRKRFSKEIKEELKRKITGKAYDKAVSESDFEVYSVLELNGDEYLPDEDAELSIVVDIIPEFELPEYIGIPMEVEATEATEQEVDDAILGMREQRADYNVVERPAEKGDYVRCSYTGKIGDELIADLVPDAPLYGTQKMTWEEAGREDSPGVSAVVEGLVGMAAGDTGEVEMEFPADFQIEALQGKSATYEVHVEEVREKVLPEVDEKFLEGLQVDSLDSLREQTRRRIEDQKKNRNASHQREQIQRALLENADFPVPESAIEQQTQVILRDYVQRSMQQGVTQEELENRRDELYESAGKAALERFKVRLILEKIAEKEKIEITNEEMSKAVMQEAMMTRTQPEKLVNELKKDRGRVQALRENLLINKTLDLIVEKGETVKAKSDPSGSKEDEPDESKENLET